MSVVRTLRALPMLAQPQDRPTAASPLSLLLAAGAVAAQLTVSSNLLTVVGIAYNTEGGNPLVKFHPGTYLAIAALLVRLFASGQPLRTLEQLLGRFPRTALFLAMITLCIAMVIVNIGVGGVAVYVESYFSAGVLLLVIGDSTLRERRLLGWLLMALFVMNAVVATGETMVQRTLLPVYLAHGTVFHDVAYEFRGMALYDHALTGGTMTEMGLLLLVGMRLSPRLTLMLGLPLFVGLISFGGRTSLLFCSATLLGIGGYTMARKLLDRTLRPVVIVGAIVGLVAAAALLWFLISETSIGVRLAGKLSFSDDSSTARSVEWLMPGLMNWSELLFGMSTAREVEYIYQLGLVYKFQIVENFWLVALMNLGIIGFTFYLTGFFAFLLDMWRLAPLFGRAILLTTIIVASTSNSLGRKSNVLFVMTAAIVATTGFARTRTARAGSARPVLGRELVPLRPIVQGGALRSLAPPPGFDDAVPDPAPTSAPATSPGLGGLLRDPTQPVRALRPLRLTTART